MKRLNQSIVFILLLSTLFLLISCGSSDLEDSQGHSETWEPYRLNDKSPGGTFVDTYNYPDKIGGNLSITKAIDEDFLDSYVIWWADGNQTKLGSNSIYRLSKTGSDLSVAIADNTDLPSGATHFLILTEREGTQMTNGVNIPINDLDGRPTELAQSIDFMDIDADADELMGDLDIGKASNEASVDSYVIYWGETATTKLNGSSAIDTVTATGSDFTYNFSVDSAVPAGATHFLVFTRNAYGEMDTGLSKSIADYERYTIAPLTIVDSTTNLMWYRYAGINSSCGNTPEQLDFIQGSFALAVCNIGLATFTDWRVPTRTEFATIAGEISPVESNPYFLNGVNSIYWTDTHENALLGWCYDLDDGDLTLRLKTESHYIMLVRDN